MDVFYYINYLIKPFISAKKVFTTSKGLYVSIPTLAYISTFHVENQALLFAGVLVLIDFITGILVSFKIARDEAKRTNSYATKSVTEKGFFARLMHKIKFYLDVIESKKLRLSLLKVVVYMFLIIGAKTLQIMFKLKPFELSFSEVKWSITLIMTSICCLFEMHSIIMENVKNLGYDLVDKIFSVSKTYKEVKEKINERDN